MTYTGPVSAQTILNDFSDFFCDSMGDLNKCFTQITSFEKATEDNLVFSMEPKSMAKALDSSAGCILAPLNLKERATPDRTWLFSKNVELAACMVKRKTNSQTPYRSQQSGIHPTAFVSTSASLAEGVTVAPHATIGEGCHIGQNCFIGANAVIEANTTIGENSTIHPLAYIGQHCVIGKNCEVQPQAVIGSEGFGYAHDHLGQHHRIPHTGRVILEDDVHVGAGTCIDRGTLNDSIIGQGTKLDNQCHFAHNSVIGKNGLVTAQFVNAGSATIGSNFICGGKAVVAGHTKTTDNVQIAALSAIHKNVDKPGQYGGYPLQPIKEFFKTKATLNHITDMRRKVNKLMMAVFPEDKS